jgi:hypothetical protein
MPGLPILATHTQIRCRFPTLVAQSLRMQWPLDGSGLQKLQTCTAWASNALYITSAQTSTRLIASLLCPATSSGPTWLLPYLRWSHGGCLDGRIAEIADLYGLGLQRIAPLPRYQPLPGLSHHYYAQQHLQCPLGFYHTCGGLMVAA